jgi:hypothetical protein
MAESTRPRPSRAERLFVDLAATFALVTLEGVVTLVVCYRWAIPAWADDAQAQSAPSTSTVAALAAVTLAVALVAFGLFRARSPIAGTSQALLALVLAFVTLAGAAAPA